MNVHLIKRFFFGWVLSFCASIDAGMIDTSELAPYEICGLCHNLDGISFMAKFPKLAGQKPGYIKQQFLNFNSGQRANDGGQMQAITTEVDMSSLDEIANYFAALPPPPATTKIEVPDLLALGQRLFEEGKDGVTACIACHGDVASSAPWLFGQHAQYLQKQLMDFVEDERQSVPMQAVANGLTEVEIEAVAQYLSSIQPR